MAFLFFVLAFLLPDPVLVYLTWKNMQLYGPAIELNPIVRFLFRYGLPGLVFGRVMYNMYVILVFFLFGEWVYLVMIIGFITKIVDLLWDLKEECLWQKR